MMLKNGSLLYYSGMPFEAFLRIIFSFRKLENCLENCLSQFMNHSHDHEVFSLGGCRRNTLTVVENLFRRS